MGRRIGLEATNFFHGDEYFSQQPIWRRRILLGATNLFRSDESLFLATNLRGDDLVSRRQSYFRGTIFKGGRLLKCLVSRKITTPFFPPILLRLKVNLHEKRLACHTIIGPPQNWSPRNVRGRKIGPPGTSTAEKLVPLGPPTALQTVPPGHGRSPPRMLVGILVAGCSEPT